jgi:N-acetylmuramoyl-L-alanine amidase
MGGVIMKFFVKYLLKWHKASSLANRIWLTIGLTVFLTSCTSLSLTHMQSKNFSQRIKFLVMHFTAIDYQKSVTALVDEGGLSAHYLIPERNDPTYQDKKLEVIQLVDESSRAWHAGISYWQGRKDLNDQSIGIEIVNVPECMRDEANIHLQQENGPNRLCLFPDYDPQQIELLITLSKDILARNPDISPTAVVGHSDIAPTRKNDPGPRFPWYQLYQNGIGAWYDNDTLKTYWEMFNDSPASIGLIQHALNVYGYDIIETGIIDSATLDTLSAFQMHFLPWSVNGKLDSKTAAVLFALIDKYFPKKVDDLLIRYQIEKLPEPPVTNLSYYQINDVFPNIERSTREWVNDRGIFKSYDGEGDIIIDNVNAQSAEIYINGKKLNIETALQPYQRYNYSLAKRTKNGENTLRVENVLPEGSSIRVMIPYPKLKKQYSPDSDKRFAKVDKLINNDIDTGFPGAVLLVVKDGKVIKRSAYGYARKFADGGLPLEKPIKMKADHLFDLASNTKMFATNFALMKLVSEGKINVNNPISNYLAEYQGQGRESRLVRDLLTHTAGYSPQVRFFTKDNELGPAFFSQNKTQTEHLLLSKVPFEMGRQTKSVYSDTDYMLLSLLIERVTNKPLDLYAEQHIYNPLGLSNTLFNPLQKGFSKNQFAATEIMGTTRGGKVYFDNVRTHVLQGEVHDEKAFHSFAGVAGHAGLFSTVDDLAVLTQTLLNGGGYGKHKVFDHTVLDKFIKPEENDASFGLGWRRAANGQRKWHFGPYASASAYGHTGWTGTVTVIDPEYDLAIILLTNARHSEIVEREDKDPEFEGKLFETGKFGSIVSLVYEAVLDNQ